MRPPGARSDLIRLMKAVLAIDLGTSGSRVIAFAKDGRILAKAYSEIPQHFPKPGWVEHDPFDYVKTTFKALRQVIARVGAQNVVSLGFTNQRETTIVWDRHTGRPVYPAIVWQDRRTEAYCQRLERHQGMVRAKTGLPIDAYFSASKLRWILDTIPQARQLAREGRLLFGTPDVWLLWNLTGRRTFATDVTNASRTLLFNIRHLSFDHELLRLFGVPASVLPEVKDSDADFGVTDAAITGRAIPINAILGDQQAALFAQAGLDRNVIKNTYGTGLFLLVNTGTQVISSRALVSTVAWRIRGRVNYALEGSILMGGAALHWLRDSLKILPSYAQAEALARSVPSSEGVYLVPAFQGLGAPYWKNGTTALVTGLTRRTSRATVVRAALEAMAYQSRDVIDVMRRTLGGRFRALRVDGGGCQNDFLMQFQSDLLNLPIERPRVTDTTALGAAMLSGWNSGFWTLSDLECLRKVERVFRPSSQRRQRQKEYVGWQTAIRRVLL